MASAAALLTGAGCEGKRDFAPGSNGGEGSGADGGLTPGNAEGGETSGTVALTIDPTEPLMFESILSAMPENEWVQLNINQFRDVWTPAEQRPWYGSPDWIIRAWSAATWDAYRSEYIFWGGGHAAYNGNEVYTWSARTLQWERASLPSEVRFIGGDQWETVDGYQNSPIASHAYDNIEYLEVADRMVTFGGAAFQTGSWFVETNGTTGTGPYFWDPSKADPSKVGGLTGSHVNPGAFPDVLGGVMWENRAVEGSPPPGSPMVSGATDYARIDGGFLNGRTGWLNGDFDLNNVVNFDDYSLIDQAFNTQGGALRETAENAVAKMRRGEGSRRN